MKPSSSRASDAAGSVRPATVTAFGPAHADVYEEAYRGRGKDWALEAADIARLIRARRPQADSLLDVACGTGAHLETFRSLFGEVAGVEISPAMRVRAQRRLPGVEVYSGDMRDFVAGRSFDAVTCLYTAISYLPSVADMRRAVRTMAHHLVVGGVLVVEPWWYPDQFIPGYVGGDLVRSAGRTIARVSHTTRLGRVARMEVQWVVGEPGGLRTFAVVEAFTMFAREELAAAFDAAGCDVEIDDDWLTGHGLFVGVRRTERGSSPRVTSRPEWSRRCAPGPPLRATSRRGC